MSGIHIRLFHRKDPDSEPQEHMLEFLVYPLPEDKVLALGLHLKDVVGEWLVAQGITSDEPATSIPVDTVPRPKGGLFK